MLPTFQNAVWAYWRSNSWKSAAGSYWPIQPQGLGPLCVPFVYKSWRSGYQSYSRWHCHYIWLWLESSEWLAGKCQLYMQWVIVETLVIFKIWQFNWKNLMKWSNDKSINSSIVVVHSRRSENTAEILTSNISIPLHLWTFFRHVYNLLQCCRLTYVMSCCLVTSCVNPNVTCQSPGGRSFRCTHS